MKAILITPETQEISLVEVGSRGDIATLVGFDTIASDEVGAQGDRLYFDEECFIRGDAIKGRFQLDTLIPVSGKAVIVGSTAEQELSDAAVEIDDLKSRIKYL